MMHRSTPPFERPDSWRILAIMALIFAVLNGALFGWSLIYGTPNPFNLVIAVTFSMMALGCLLKARKLDR